MTNTVEMHAGALVHRLVGELLTEQRTAPPSGELFEHACQLVLENPFPGCERLGVQRIVGMTRVALDLALSWDFMGCEVSAGSGRVDLVWGQPLTGSVLIDELKAAGVGAVIDDATTHAQVLRYLNWGIRAFGDRFAGLRLLALSAPRRSLLFTPDAPNSPKRLIETALWSSASIPKDVGT